MYQNRGVAPLRHSACLPSPHIFADDVLPQRIFSLLTTKKQEPCTARHRPLTSCRNPSSKSSASIPERGYTSIRYSGQRDNARSWISVSTPTPLTRLLSRRQRGTVPLTLAATMRTRNSSAYPRGSPSFPPAWSSRSRLSVCWIALGPACYIVRTSRPPLPLLAHCFLSPR